MSVFFFLWFYIETIYIVVQWRVGKWLPEPSSGMFFDISVKNIKLNYRK